LSHAIKWIQGSWFSKVRDETIINCFIKCGFQRNLSALSSSALESDDSLTLLNEVTLLAETVGVEDFNNSEETPVLFNQSSNWEEEILNPTIASMGDESNSESDEELQLPTWKEFKAA